MLFQGCGTAIGTRSARDGLSGSSTTLSIAGEEADRRRHQLLSCPAERSGESPRSTHREHLRVVEITWKKPNAACRCWRARAVTTPPEVIKSPRKSKRWAADGISRVTPYYNKPTQEGLYQHYKAIAAAVQLPIHLYIACKAAPAVNVEPATLRRAFGNRLHRSASRKLGQTISQMAQVVHQVPSKLAGVPADGLHRDSTDRSGGHGVGVGGFKRNSAPVHPSLRSALLRMISPAARELQRQLLPLMEVNFVESNPIPVKAGHGVDGLLEPVWRLPLCPAQSGQISRRSKKVVEALGLFGRPERACRLRSRELFDQPPAAYTDHHFDLFQRFKQALNAGEIRAAEPDGSSKTGWRVNAWVKKGILLGFRMGAVVDMSIDATGSPGSIKRHFRCSAWRWIAGSALFPADPAFAMAATSAGVLRAWPPMLHQHGEAGWAMVP